MFFTSYSKNMGESYPRQVLVSNFCKYLPT